MNIHIKQSDLSSGLSAVLPVVPGKDYTLPVLTNVLLAVEDDGSLRLSTTNLEVGVTCWVAAQSGEAGTISVPAHTLTDLVKMLPDGDVHLALDKDDTTLLVNEPSGSSHAEIKGIAASEFPPLPEAAGAPSVKVSAAALKNAIRQTAFAVARDMTRPVLTGVLLKASDSNLILTAADGFRLSRRRVEAEVLSEMEAIVPVKALNILEKYAADEEVSIWVADNQVIFAAGSIRVASRMIDASFPDVEVIISAQTPTMASVSRDALFAACRQALVVARDGGNLLRLQVVPGEDDSGKIHLVADVAEVGHSENQVAGDVRGDAVRLGINAGFLLDAVSCIGATFVSIGFGGDMSPVKVTDGDYLHLIIPLHISSA